MTTARRSRAERRRRCPVAGSSLPSRGSTWRVRCGLSRLDVDDIRRHVVSVVQAEIDLTVGCGSQPLFGCEIVTGDPLGTPVPLGTGPLILTGRLRRGGVLPQAVVYSGRGRFDIERRGCLRHVRLLGAWSVHLQRHVSLPGVRANGPSATYFRVAPRSGRLPSADLCSADLYSVSSAVTGISPTRRRPPRNSSSSRTASPAACAPVRVTSCGRQRPSHPSPEHRQRSTPWPLPEGRQPGRAGNVCPYSRE